MSNFSTTMESLIKSADAVLSSKTVVGDAKVVGDTTIIPLVDVSFGIAAGGNSNDKKNGAAGGITGKMEPSSVLIIKDGKTKLVNIRNQETLAKLVDLIPDVLDKFMAKKSDMMDDEKATEIAFPEESE